MSCLICPATPSASPSHRHSKWDGPKALPATSARPQRPAATLFKALWRTALNCPPLSFEHYMHPIKSAKRSMCYSPAHGIFVYVDDFIGAAVEDKKDPVLLKKLERGDAWWYHERAILGFLVNGQTKTVQILDAKATNIVMEIRPILKKKHVQIKRYCQIMGKLRHVALILPGIRGLFFHINKALKGEPQVIGLGKTSNVQAAFLDLAHMVAHLATRPTHVKELVPGDDHYTGYCDACAASAGGVWLGGNVNLRPIVWRAQFSESITSQVVSKANPRCHLTNLDLEMAAVLHSTTWCLSKRWTCDTLGPGFGQITHPPWRGPNPWPTICKHPPRANSCGA
jgi:hypothetical protein